MVTHTRRSVAAAALALAGVCALTTSAPRPVEAMTLARHGGTLILSGDIERRDLDRITAAFDSAPTITHVVLRNSRGGNSWTGYRLGEFFRARGVTTVVSGHCVSSCSRLFLGGVVRQFADDFPASLTYVGLHGHYDFDRLNRDAVTKNDLVAWTLRFTEGRADPALVRRWVAIEARAGDIRFYPPAARSRFGHTTMLCQGNESRRPDDCEAIATTALAQGIVTTDAPWSSPDAATLVWGQRRRAFPDSGYAALDATERVPARSGNASRDYERFRRAALPRAFAASADGSHWGWAGNDPRSVDAAIERCQRGAPRVRCQLYAVDERVVWRPDASQGGAASPVAGKR
ncbi:MAG: hypothetical protein LC098_11715 [Burkholderiales bacterium]|nr:hypothetical protein [Burkholderiales bacterium]